MLNKLGIKTDIYHCNEGHAALLSTSSVLWTMSAMTIFLQRGSPDGPRILTIHRPHSCPRGT